VYPSVIYGVFVHSPDYLKKTHIVAKDVVGLLLGALVSTKKSTSSQRMWLAYKYEIVRIIESLTKMKTY
jgi:hypothetical protein